MYAIIKTGGKQYRVNEGDVIRVEKLALEKGAKIEFVSLLAAEGATVTTDGKVKVTGEVMAHNKGTKIYIDKYKSGIQYRRRNGHRQLHTDVKITSVK